MLLSFSKLTFMVLSKLLSDNSEANKILYLFSRAVITKYHRLGDFDKRNVFSHSSEGFKSRCQRVWFLACRWLLAVS